MKEAVLCFVRRGDPPAELLLGRKKYGFGQGKYGGFGGKVEPGETPAGAAVRELAEEVGLAASVEDLELVAHVTFHFPHRPGWDHAMHAFLVHRWCGAPIESAEMAPAWFPLDAIPYDAMWDDALSWVPLILAGKRITARFTYDHTNQRVAQAEVQEWTEKG